jgi:hypothetical protein
MVAVFETTVERVELLAWLTDVLERRPISGAIYSLIGPG